MIEKRTDTWAVRATLINKSCADIRAVEMFAPDSDPPEYMCFDEHGSGVGTTDWDAAEWIVEGSVSFDGCGNLHWNQKDGVLHTCSCRRSCDLLRLVYATAAEAMEKPVEGVFADRVEPCTDCASATALYAEAKADVAHLNRWVNDLQAGCYINCVYCGHRYGPDDEVPAAMADVLKTHIEQCPEHPLAAATQTIASLQAKAIVDEAIVERLSAQRDDWKSASGLIIGGDPDGIEPHHLEADLRKRDAECVALKEGMVVALTMLKRAIEAGNLALYGWRNDPHELEMGQDEVEDLLDIDVADLNEIAGTSDV